MLALEGLMTRMGERLEYILAQTPTPEPQSAAVEPQGSEPTRDHAVGQEMVEKNDNQLLKQFLELCPIRFKGMKGLDKAAE